MVADRKLWWAVNFFIWTAISLLVLSVFPIYDSYLQFYLRTSYSSSLHTLAGFIGFMVAGIARTSWLNILALINGLIVRRYKSRISAALFIAFGLWGLIAGGVGTPLDLVFTLFWGAYFLIAVWTLRQLSS
jgi:hypothetical protein